MRHAFTFFGSNKGLYQSIIERMVADVEGLVVLVEPPLVVGTSGGRGENMIVYSIEAYMDFLPTFCTQLEG